MPFDLLPSTLEELFSFNPPVRIQPQWARKERRLIGISPFNFYDRHINEQQVLKRVILLPSLLEDIIQSVDDCLSELKRCGQGPRPAMIEDLGDFLNALNEIAIPGEVRPDALSSYFADTVARTCLALTSTWAIHPRTEKYYSVLEFDPGNRDPPKRQDEVHENYSLYFVPFDRVNPEILSSVDENVKRSLKDLAEQCLATWLFLPLSPHTEMILRDMDRMAQLPRMPSVFCFTQGIHIPTKEQLRTCDAKAPSWRLPASTYNHQSDDCSAFLVYNESISPGPAVNERRTTFEKMRDSTPEGLMHHAWQLAVRDDTTVIVFNCGNHERIGIRHRATQTLYLSDVIDITRYRPSYGKLHLGLQMSIIKDVLDRHQQRYTASPPTLGKRSLQEDNPGLRKSKRQKMNTLKASALDKFPLSNRDTKTFWEELGKRHVATVQMRESHLKSSVPAFCVRKGGSLSPYGLGRVSRTQKKKYNPSEYIKLTLDSNCGSGATAIAHTAQLQIVLSNGRKLTRGVVVKVATSEETKKRIRHEHAVYKHLWAHRVKRIPEVYGLFEDLDNLATFFVMERACFSFRDREPIPLDGIGYLQEVTPEERAKCVAILKNIHHSGIVHRDLRANNIAIAQDGKPIILDFDRAKFNATEEAKLFDMGYLTGVLDGKTTNIPVTSSS